ncbi:hypothetical protein OSG_eHP23_00125 [environmental Halophage eHP-23]|nr:hypothetical protein OSG_eHP23_00125 [environmental Halophage eHP-23]
MTQTTKGKVEAVNDRSDEDWYGVKVDGDWYNGNDSLHEEIEEASIVAVKYTEQQNADSSWNSIENIKRTGGTSPNTGSKAGGASNSSFSKQDRIKAQVAFKEACETVRQQKNSSNIDEHFEQVNSLANGYRQVLDKQFKEEMQE